MKKTKVLIAGIGGVGGYFGGLLAKNYQNNSYVEIYFLARGNHLAEINENGLKVLKGNLEFVAHPFLATDNVLDIGVVDYILVCCKGYDLDKLINGLQPCINSDTVILPLLNGVDAKNSIQSIYPNNLVLDGCAYIVARLKSPGIIENSGKVESLYFGIDDFSDDKMDKLESLLKDAGIDATHSTTISKVVWDKFIFISAIATATSYYNKTIGEILLDDSCAETVSTLLNEVIQLAQAKQIKIAEDTHQKTMSKYASLPFETTTSMHSDFRSGKTKTEIESLTGYVVREVEVFGIEVPMFEKCYNSLL